MGKILSRLAVLASKIETTEGVAEALANVDANILAGEPKFTPDIPMFERDLVDGSLSRHAALAGTRGGEISFKVLAKGSGTAGTPPSWGKLLKACGFGETIVASTSVTYAPKSLHADIKTLTIGLYRQGLKKLLRGCRGSVKLSLRNGQPMALDFRFRGVYGGVTDVAMLTATGVDQTREPVFLNASFDVGGFAALIETLELDWGRELALQSDVNKQEGWASCLIVDANPVGTMDPEEELVATHDWHGRWINGTLGSLGFELNGGAGNIITVNAPACQYMRVQEGNRNKLATLGLDFALRRSSEAGDDELTIVCT